MLKNDSRYLSFRSSQEGMFKQVDSEVKLSITATVNLLNPVESFM